MEKKKPTTKTAEPVTETPPVLTTEQKRMQKNINDLRSQLAIIILNQANLINQTIAAFQKLQTIKA